jgi:hypothetical protein
MYTGAACLVLFDARGGPVEMPYVCVLALIIQTLLIGISYMPAVFYRPRLVDALCADVLTFATHVAGIAICIREPVLQFACVLHTLCFCMEKRYLGQGSGPSYTMFIHTLMGMLLIAAYFYGPRVTDLYPFVIGAAWPHVMEMVAAIVIRTHKLAVTYITDVAS